MQLRFVSCFYHPKSGKNNVLPVHTIGRGGCAAMPMSRRLVYVALTGVAHVSCGACGRVVSGTGGEWSPSRAEFGVRGRGTKVA